MDKNIIVNGNIHGVGIAQDGSIVNQNLILPEHKVPTQLTSKLGKDSIIGREKELKEIDELLNSSNSLLLINGIGGIGKSTIASYYLHSQKDKLNYYGFFEGIESFINELREPLDLKQEKQEEAFIEALAKLRKLEGEKLLVIDDVKDIEENQETIERILELKNSGYKILLTSREEIEDVEQYYLDVLSMIDAKKLFNSIFEVEDEVLLEEILGYLDCHAFFVEMTAKTLKSKKTLTLEIIKEKFESGEFSTIKRKRKESFNDYLNELFSFDELDNEEILMLKQLSVLPSIEIEFSFLQEIFDRKDDESFEEILDYLCQKGWLNSFEDRYKLHQIIQEYILVNYAPLFKDIEMIIDEFQILIGNSTDMQISVNNRDNIIYFESLIILFKKLKLENEKIGNFLSHVGNIFFHLGFYKGGENIHLKALELRKKILGEKHTSTATSYDNLAGFYELKGEYDKAEIFSLRALEIREKILGVEDYETAISYNNLGSLYQQMGKYVKAEVFYFKDLKITKKLRGEENPSIATSYANLALVYESMEEYEKAKKICLKALEIREKILGEEHPETASSYNGLALLYSKMENYKESESFYFKALKIQENILGDNHPNTMASYQNLALLYSLMREYIKSEKLYLKVLKIQQSRGEEDCPLNRAILYNNLALLYRQMRRYNKAENFYFRALKIRKELFGDNHPDTVSNYYNLAVLYGHINDWKKAFDYFTITINIWEETLPINHPDLLNAKMHLEAIKSQIKISSKKIKRNDPCPCNSGKKYKKCCGRNN